MRMAVVDDDPTFIEAFSATVTRYMRGSGARFSLASFPKAEAFLRVFDAAELSPFDLVFLDILLPEESGLELAKSIYARDRACGIVYVTASPDYAMQGYGVNALSYLLKPIGDAELAATFAAWAAHHRDEERSREAIWLKICGELRRIAPPAILYAESEDKRVYLHMDGGERCEKIVWQGKLGDLTDRLPPQFMRVHQSYTVNLDRAYSLRADRIVLDNGAEIPVSYRYRSDVAERFFSAAAATL